MGDEYEVTMTHTAKSKEFRYLKSWEIEQHIHDPEAVYYDPERETYLLPVTRTTHQQNLNHGREEKIVIIVSVVDDGSQVVVVSQTGDHYNWANFEKVDSIGAWSP